jgi:hypothetical protein
MTQDEIILLADASGISLYGMGKDRDKFIQYLQAFAKLVAAKEREACAKVCEKHAEVYASLPKMLTTDASWAACIDSRDAIRARGEA